MFVARNVRSSASKFFCRFQWRSFCKNSSRNGKETRDAIGSSNGDGGGNLARRETTYMEAYKDLDKLDFMKAAKILFTAPPKQKKFGIDFHLVQLFFVCLPSLAVYLVAQYARYEMRKMDAELDMKEKAEEEAKAKEMEAKEAKEREERSRPDPELLIVKERLEALEETVKEIVTEKKKPKGDGNIQGSRTPHVPREQTSAGADDNQGGQSGKTNVKEGVARDEDDVN